MRSVAAAQMMGQLIITLGARQPGRCLQLDGVLQIQLWTGRMSKVWHPPIWQTQNSLPRTTVIARIEDAQGIAACEAGAETDIIAAKIRL